MQIIGFLGCGNMGECILAGLLRSGAYSSGKIFVFNRTRTTVDRLCKEHGVRAACCAADLAEHCNIVVIGVKPYGVAAVLGEIEKTLRADTIVVSVAAGVTIGAIERIVPKGTKVVRAMPNVPTSVGEGMTSITPNVAVTKEEIDIVKQLFMTVGKVEVVSEAQVHAVIGAAGSAPAYAFMIIEAMGDAAVRGGLPRAQAYRLAAQAMLGASKMVLESEKGPGELKDMVCSPGGTTIEAVRYLEKGGMRSAMIEAMIKCMERSVEMEREFS